MGCGELVLLSRFCRDIACELPGSGSADRSASAYLCVRRRRLEPAATRGAPRVLGSVKMLRKENVRNRRRSFAFEAVGWPWAGRGVRSLRASGDEPKMAQCQSSIAPSDHAIARGHRRYSQHVLLHLRAMVRLLNHLVKFSELFRH